MREPRIASAEACFVDEQQPMQVLHVALQIWHATVGSTAYSVFIMYSALCSLHRSEQAQRDA